MERNFPLHFLMTPGLFRRDSLFFQRLFGDMVPGRQAAAVHRKAFDMARYKKYLYLPLCFLSLLGNGVWFQWMYADHTYHRWTAISLALIFCWSLALTAVAALLPRLGKRIYMGLLGVAFFALTVVHAVYYNMFRKFFSFADMFFAGDGFAFLDASYLVIRKLAILLGLACLGLMAAAVVLAPKGEERRPRFLVGLAGLLVGAAGIAGVCLVFFQGGDTMIWDMGADPATVYQDFTDTKASLSLLGLYHYTFRDIQLVLFPGGREMTDEEVAEVEAFAAQRSHESNDMTGALAGKNLILIQLEAIDTWMVDYMPNLQAVKEQSVVFSNHYTPAYITAGTFNTEFIVNTGLLPAATGTPTSVYTRNTFPNSLAHLFAGQGYAANSFHGSEGDVYNRGSIHDNWGYTYHSGSDMGMPNYTMDSDLMAAFDDMTAGDPFFTFIITYSGHGPYSDQNPIYLAHADEARAEAERTDGNYVYAVAHAKETDQFVGELMEALEEGGLLENTAVVFYADHYNYYMLDDNLNMDIKGVDSLNLLQHTDFFIYARDLAPQVVEKYTSSIDVLPTLANLFDLPAEYELLTGDDAFSPDGGYIFFNDNTWVGTDADVSGEIALRRRINSLLLGGDYWGQ